MEISKTEIVIMNRYELENWKPYENKTYLVISISENDKVHFPINQACRGILSLQFEDIDCRPENKEQTENYKKQYKIFTKKQAKQILKFINEITNIDTIICQCSAGISRSAGVAAALGVILNGSDKEIFNDPRYCPNRFVYRTILNEYENQLDNWSKE